MEHILKVNKQDKTIATPKAFAIPWSKVKSMLTRLVVAQAMSPTLDLQHFERLEAKKTIQNFNKF